MFVVGLTLSPKMNSSIPSPLLVNLRRRFSPKAQLENFVDNVGKRVYDGLAMKKRPKNARIDIRVPAETFDGLTQLALKAERDFPDYVRRALADHVARSTKLKTKSA